MSRVQQSVSRVRRSIPELDAVNPAYFDFDSQQPDQERPMDPQGDVSQLSLTDHVASLFRSHKPVKEVQKPQARLVGQGERAMNLAKDEEAVVVGGLPVDEQEDCYRQQNLEPPVSQPKRAYLQAQEPLVMPVMDVAQGPEPTYVRNNNQFNRKYEGRHNEREREKLEVNSLYSDPEETVKYKQKKHKNEPIDYEPIDYKVFKPVGVEADFPIYDQDIDFDPDPLQGVLDDKYWLDPQEREEVVRKYIDLAADNMMPDKRQAEKRSADENRNNGKSAVNKVSFKNMERKCPCKVISACEECSKGKGQKKSNCTDTNDESVSYGRKLLSLSDDQEDYEGDEGGSFLEIYKDKVSRDINDVSLADSPLGYKDVHLDTSYDEESQIDVNFIRPPNFVGRKLLSIDLSEEENSEESLESLTSDVSLKGSKLYNMGKHLLWNEYYDENDESYNDDENIFQNDSKLDNSYFGNDVSNNSLKYFPNSNETENNDVTSKRILRNAGLTSNVHRIKHSLMSKKNSVYEPPNKFLGYYEPNKLANALEKPFKIKTKVTLKNITNFHNDHGLDVQLVDGNSDKGLPDKLPRYYKSNQILNTLQKPFQDKAKGPVKNRTDTANLFEKLKNETLVNATYEATSEIPPRTSVCFKRSNEEPLKGRRSYSEFSFDKNQLEGSLLQSHDDSGSSNNNGENKTTNVSQQNVNSTISPKSNLTVTSITSSVPFSGAGNDSKTKIDDIPAEERLDSQIANNIVESVISESQKSLVFGHSLGVCRKNESVIKVKYGKIVPEAEKVIKTVTDCIMDRIRSHLAKQSCILLDSELLEFLKWMVLGGESYKDYMRKLGPPYYDFIPAPPPTTCAPPSSVMCDSEPLPPNPNVFSSLGNSESGDVFS